MYVQQQIGLWLRSEDKDDREKAAHAIIIALCSCGAIEGKHAPREAELESKEDCSKGDMNRAAAKLEVGYRSLARWVSAIGIDTAAIKARHGMPHRGGARPKGSALKHKKL